MKLNCTYKLTDRKGFVGIPGAQGTNERLARIIENHGTTIRPTHIDNNGCVKGFILGDNSKAGEHYSHETGHHIGRNEYKHFTKVAEGYPEVSNDFPTIKITVTNREQAQKAIESLEALLKC